MSTHSFQDPFTTITCKDNGCQLLTTEMLRLTKPEEQYHSRLLLYPTDKRRLPGMLSERIARTSLRVPPMILPKLLMGAGSVSSSAAPFSKSTPPFRSVHLRRRASSKTMSQLTRR